MPFHRTRYVVIVFALTLSGLVAGCSQRRVRLDQFAPPPDSVLQSLHRDALAVDPLVESTLAKNYVAAVVELPPGESRTIYKIKDRKDFYTATERANLSEPEKNAAEPREISEAEFYHTKYGSPLAYARAMDLLGSHRLTTFRKKKFLDFGYGGIGQLRLMALNGATAVGVDVDPYLSALYCQPGDQGPIGHHAGTVSVVHGRFPADGAVNRAVGSKFDVFLSKNTLKRGYLHPPTNVEVDPRKLIQLGVDDDTFIRSMYALLKPGGLVMIYNLCPAPAKPGQPYIPWADGRCPFKKEDIESAGFVVHAFDQDDSAKAREFGQALGWDKGDRPMNLENDLFAWYTLLEKPK